MPVKLTHKTCHVCEERLPRESFLDIPRSGYPPTRLDDTCFACRGKQVAYWEHRRNIPDKACECGCGLLTNRAQKTDERLGWVVGEPMRFRKGHGTGNRRYALQPYIVDDCGYDTPCWVWQRSKDKDGYGRTFVDNRAVPAHRVYFEREYGELPPGWVADHLCRNTSCVNPAHLRALTLGDNSRFKASSILNYEKAMEIRELAKTMTQADITRKLGLSRSTVSEVIRGKHW